MITVEEARKYYPLDQCPPDAELERIISAAYRIANLERELRSEERNYEQQ